MSADERILRLENAMATLAEMSANQEQRTARLEESFRLLTQVVAEQQRRTTRLEESFVMLTELTRSHDERLDELRAETERGFAAMTNAMKQMAEAQAHSDRRMDALIDVVQNWRNGKWET